MKPIVAIVGRPNVGKSMPICRCAYEVLYQGKQVRDVNEAIRCHEIEKVGQKLRGYMAGRTINNSLDTFHIGLPGTIGTSVGVGNLNTKGHTLFAKLALSHPLHLLAVGKSPAL